MSHPLLSLKLKRKEWVSLGPLLSHENPCLELRGLTHPSAIRSLRVKVSKHSLDVIFLFETKSCPLDACIILNRLGFILLAHVSHVGSKGGLLLAWRNGVELECFVTNINTIIAWCYTDSPSNP